MRNKLSEMTLDELWQLFPIILTEHQNYWKDWYSEEEHLLKNTLPQIERISHIGSTAISFIWAKPIIDILIEIPTESTLSDYKDLILSSGYICMMQSENELSFNKGYTENGFANQVFHLHLRKLGDNDELYFRDYLIDFPFIAREYEKLKISLWKENEHNRDAYTNAKTAFVKKYTEQAKIFYGNKY